MTVAFEQEKRDNIRRLGAHAGLRSASLDWIAEASRYKYSYHFTWMGRPIIQFPQDVLAIQEIVWNVKPDLIVETGIAHGGSLVFSASLLELLGGDRRVVGVDIDIRSHNRAAIESHPLFHRITLLEGSSVDREIFGRIAALAQGRRTLVMLDSNHTHEHVLEELRLYSPLVEKGSYVVVFDTVIEDLPDDFFPDRPWGRGNNPRTAVVEFLSGNQRFQVDRELDAKLVITAAPGGYLKCISD